MRGRLEALGVSGVTARTFHSAALAQLHWLGGAPSRILPSKALTLRRIANSLPPPYKFRPAGDLATEVEWAKNRRLTPDTYLEGLGEHEPPIPRDLMRKVFRFYEAEKAERGFVDFEDLLELAVRLFDEDERAVAEVRARYRAFTVDEYQDVNLLQQSLLDSWLGPSEELCAVGDDYQSIYAFTGATPACRSVFRTRRWCDWRRITVPRRKCSPWRTGSFRLWAARRRCCGRPATTGRSPSRARFRQASSSAPLSSSRCVACTTAACRMKRSPSCAARTRAWPTSRSRSTSPRFRSRARRCSPVKLRGNS